MATTILNVSSDGTNLIVKNGLTVEKNINGTLNGNASTATKLANARTLTIGSTGKSFDGSANVSWSLSEIGAAASSHTHNYAGSSSVGGSANSAVKLDSSAGSATQPIYFSGGKPVATTYALNKTVPSNAVFTDTTYSVATTSANGLMSSADKTKLNKIKISAMAVGSVVITLRAAGTNDYFTINKLKSLLGVSGFTKSANLEVMPIFVNGDNSTTNTCCLYPLWYTGGNCYSICSQPVVANKNVRCTFILIAWSYNDGTYS